METGQLMSFEPVRIEMPSGLEEIVPAYLEWNKQRVRDMSGLLSASAFERLEVFGHQLKASGGGYGLPELTRLGAALEESAKQTDRPHLQAHLTQLETYLDRVELVAKV
jgi:HPt (histidine-containing phosphotransfer) domain-containing protein